MRHESQESRQPLDGFKELEFSLSFSNTFWIFAAQMCYSSLVGNLSPLICLALPIAFHFLHPYGILRLFLCSSISPSPSPLCVPHPSLLSTQVSPILLSTPFNPSIHVPLLNYWSLPLKWCLLPYPTFHCSTAFHFLAPQPIIQIPFCLWFCFVVVKL